MTTFKKARTWRDWNVAVTGVNARPESPGPGCAVARCIREHSEFQGRIIGMGYDVLDAGLYARDFCHNGYLLPYPSAGEDAFLSRIKEIHAYEKLDAIIPCLDAELQNFIRLQPELTEMGIKMLIPSRQQFLKRAKTNLAAFCESVGVHAPKTKTLTDPTFFDKCEDEGWTYPLVLKGLFYDAYIAPSRHEARYFFSKLVSSWGYPVLVQEFLTGDEFDLTAVGDGRGNLLGSVTMRKRGLTDKGKAWSGVTINDSDIADVADRLVRGLKWRGPLEVEVMRGPDGRVYLIEINPRFPAWIYLSHGVGRNLPVAVLKILDFDEDFNFAEPSTGTFFIRYAQELIVPLTEFESVFMNGESGLTLGENRIA